MSRLELDPNEIGPAATYAWLTSLVVPRPIAWVSSTSAAGIDNLAPHSFFTVSSEDPPVVQFTSVGRKDTLRNVEETGEFVVNITTENLIEIVNASGTNYPRSIGEFDALGIDRTPSALVRPPRVAASPAALECVCVGFRPFGTDDSGSTVVFGRVVHLAIREDVARDGRARIELLRPVARLGGAEWTTIGEVSRRRRIRYEDIGSG
jgi:flavin reductase (DIM6/NTAB) family NADH-FMN oxidoreductase RutF